MWILYPRSKTTFISTFTHPFLQVCCGQKRSIDEANDGAGTSDEVTGNNFFTMTDVKEVKVKKFNTTSVDYTVNLQTRSLIWNFPNFIIIFMRNLKIC